MYIIDKAGGFQPNEGKGTPTPPPNKGSGGKKEGKEEKSPSGLPGLKRR